MRPIRVCHVSLGLTTGGMERLLVDFGRFRTAAAVETCFVVLGETGEPARELRAMGLTVHEAAAPGLVSRLLRLVRIMRSTRPDVVHTHNPAPQLWGTLAARLARVPAVVHTRHGHALGSLSGVAVATLCRLADRVVCVSDDLRRDLMRRHRLAERRVVRIWNGIDTSRFAWAGPRPEPTALAVCRLSPVKDVGTLVRAVAAVGSDLPGLRARVIGDGPLRHELEQLARSLGVERRVDFLGERRDVPALLATGGFFVSSSLSEGLSLTLAEAMAVGLPVLATAVGGNPEVVVEGVTGRLVPPDDPRALADGLLALWQERDRWEQMGRAGRDRVLACFDVRRMVKDYEALYASVLA